MKEVLNAIFVVLLVQEISRATCQKKAEEEKEKNKLLAGVWIYDGIRP
jgi:hypothetical protein